MQACNSYMLHSTRAFFLSILRVRAFLRALCLSDCLSDCLSRARTRRYEWRVSHTQMEMMLSTHSLLGGSGGVTLGSYAEPTVVESFAGGLARLESSTGRTLDARWLSGSWEGSCTGSCSMMVTIEGLIVRIAFDKCVDSAGTRDPRGEGYVVASLSHLANLALHYKSAYSPSRPGSGTDFTYSYLDLTILESSSFYWPATGGARCKAIFYFPGGQPDALRMVVLHPGEDYVSPTTYPTANVFLPSYQPDQCRLWQLSRLTKGDVKAAAASSGPAALTFVADTSAAWIFESEVLEQCASALNAVEMLEGEDCKALRDLFLPPVSTGARYAYLFQRQQVLEVCNEPCAQRFETLLWASVATCSRIWKLSSSWRSQTAADSRARIFEMNLRLATSRYWYEVACSQDGSGVSCLDAVENVDQVFSAPSSCPSAQGAAASDVIPLFDFSIGPANGCSATCAAGLQQWAQASGCCASVAALAQSSWWQSIDTANQSETASAANSSLAFTISLSYAGYEYPRTYMPPERCLRSSRIVSTACALTQHCAAALPSASPGLPASCCSGAMCVGGGQRRPEQRCECECPRGRTGSDCSRAQSYIATTFYAVEVYVSGQPLMTYRVEQQRKATIARLCNVSVNDVHINRLFLAEDRHPSDLAGVPNDIRRSSSSRLRVALQVRVGVSGTLLEEHAAAKGILSSQLAANVSGVMQAEGLRLSFDAGSRGVFESAKTCNDSPLCCFADVDKGILVLPSTGEALLPTSDASLIINTNQKWFECCPEVCSTPAIRATSTTPAPVSTTPPPSDLRVVSKQGSAFDKPLVIAAGVVISLAVGAVIFYLTLRRGKKRDFEIMLLYNACLRPCRSCLQACGLVAPPPPATQRGDHRRSRAAHSHAPPKAYREAGPVRAVADEGFRSFRFEEALSKYEREMNHGPAQPGMQVTNHHYLVDHNDLGLGHSTSFPAIYTHLEEAAIRMAATRANTATHTAMHSLTHSALSATEPAVSMTREIAGPFPLTSMAYVAQDGDTYSGDVAWLESAEATPEFLNAADNSSAASHLDAEVTVGGEQGVSIGLGPSHRPRSLFSPGAGSMFAGVEISETPHLVKTPRVRAPSRTMSGRLAGKQTQARVSRGADSGSSGEIEQVSAASVAAKLEPDDASLGITSHLERLQKLNTRLRSEYQRRQTVSGAKEEGKIHLGRARDEQAAATAATKIEQMHQHETQLETPVERQGFEIRGLQDAYRLSQDPPHGGESGQHSGQSGGQRHAVESGRSSSSPGSSSRFERLTMGVGQASRPESSALESSKGASPPSVHGSTSSLVSHLQSMRDKNTEDAAGLLRTMGALVSRASRAPSIESRPQSLESGFGGSSPSTGLAASWQASSFGGARSRAARSPTAAILWTDPAVTDTSIHIVDAVPSRDADARHPSDEAPGLDLHFDAEEAGGVAAGQSLADTADDLAADPPQQTADGDLRSSAPPLARAAQASSPHIPSAAPRSSSIAMSPAHTCPPTEIQVRCPKPMEEEDEEAETDAKAGVGQDAQMVPVIGHPVIGHTHQVNTASDDGQQVFSHRSAGSIVALSASSDSSAPESVFDLSVDPTPRPAFL